MRDALLRLRRDLRWFSVSLRVPPVAEGRSTATRPTATVAGKLRSLSDQRRWYVLLGLILLLGFAVRVAYLLIFRSHFTVSGDAYYYHHGANILVDGHGFIAPESFLKHGQRVAAAQHPPGYLLALAVPSLFGLRTVLEHQLWSCVLGTATVGVIGFAGKTIANRRVGLIAALLAAVYPNLWLNDSLVMSETLILLTTAIVVLVAYKFWQRPGPPVAAGLGVAIAAAALTRAESILLVPLLAIPLVCLMRRFPWQRRLQLGAISVGATVLVLAPWVGYNLTRFDHPVTLSTNLGMTLRVANCDQTYGGSRLGYWSFRCLHETNPGHGDLSSQELVYRHASTDYINAHLSSVPVVVLARLGRTWGLFRPLQQVRLDAFLEGREVWSARAGLGSYYLLLAAAVGGIVLLRRRRVPLLPLVAPVVTVTIAVAIILGETRLRAPAEVSVVLLAAVAIEQAWRDLRDRRMAVARAPMVEEPLPLATGAMGERAGAAVGATVGTRSGNGSERPTMATLRAAAATLWRSTSDYSRRIANRISNSRAARRLSNSRAWTSAVTPQLKRLRTRSGRVVLLVVVVGTVIAVGIAIVASSASTAAPTATTAKFAVRIVKLPGGRAPKADPRYPARIIDPGQDRPNPFVLVEHGKYYLYSSQSSSLKSPTIPVWVSTDFAHWSRVKDALPKLPTWATWGSTWAPDVRRVHGRYVMYYTALVKAKAAGTRCIGAATGSSPTGPFKPIQHSLVCQLFHRGSIDPRTFVDADGTLWLHWKADDNANPRGTSHTTIYAQRLSNDGLKFVGRRTVILKADQVWEGRIVEAPQMVLANGRYWLFYSGNWYNQPKYAIGVAECRGPAGPCSKPPSSRPFLASNAQGRGPGESSLFTDGNGLWIVYGPWAVQFQQDTRRPVALAHVVFNGIGPYLGAF